VDEGKDAWAIRDENGKAVLQLRFKLQVSSITLFGEVNERVPSFGKGLHDYVIKRVSLSIHIYKYIHVFIYI